MGPEAERSNLGDYLTFNHFKIEIWFKVIDHFRLNKVQSW